MEKSKATKLIIAVLLNVFIIPGAGHIYIGQRVRGYVLSLATTVFLVVPLARYAILVSAALSNSPVHSQTPLAGMISAFGRAWPDAKELVILSLAALAIIWIFGIVDVYLRCKGDKNVRV